MSLADPEDKGKDKAAYLALRLHADHMTVFHHNVVHWLVQHVGAAIDCAQPVDTNNNYIIKIYIIKETQY